MNLLVTFGVVVLVTLGDPLAAQGATHSYKDSNLADGAWAYDSYGYSHANTGMSYISLSNVQVNNGSFTASGSGDVQQTYAQVESQLKCAAMTTTRVTKSRHDVSRLMR